MWELSYCFKTGHGKSFKNNNQEITCGKLIYWTMVQQGAKGQRLPTAK